MWSFVNSWIVGHIVTVDLNLGLKCSVVRSAKLPMKSVGY